MSLIARRHRFRLTTAPLVFVAATLMAPPAGWSQAPGPAPTPAPGRPAPGTPGAPGPVTPPPTERLPVVPPEPTWRSPFQQTPLEITPPPDTAPRPTIPAGPAAPTLPARPRVAGPLLEFTPYVTLAEEYSSNFDQTSGDTTSNFRTTLSPGIALAIEGTSLRARFAYTLTAAHDSSDNDNDVSIFHALEGVLTWEATPWLTLTISDALTRSDEPGKADTLSIRRGRDTFTANSFLGSARYRTDVFEAGAFYSRLDFLESGSGQSDTKTQIIGGDIAIPFLEANRAGVGYEYVTSANDVDITGHRGTASLTHRLSPQLALGVTGSYGIRDVNESDPTLPDDTFRIWTASLFGTYAVAPVWSGSASVGVGQVTSDHRGSDTLPLGSVSVSYALGRGVVTLSGDGGFSETFETTENAGVAKTWGVSLGYGHPLTPYISGSAVVFYRENEFTGIGDGRSEGRKDENVGGTVAVAWRALNWLTASLDYSYRQTRSNIGDFSEHRVRLALTASF